MTGPRDPDAHPYRHDDDRDTRDLFPPLDDTGHPQEPTPVDRLGWGRPTPAPGATGPRRRHPRSSTRVVVAAAVTQARRRRRGPVRDGHGAVHRRVHPRRVPPPRRSRPRSTPPAPDPKSVPSPNVPGARP